jgi:twitching motility protein PilT
MELFQKGWINADDAYLKANDKTRFRAFIKNPPADFTEA